MLARAVCLTLEEMGTRLGVHDQDALRAFWKFYEPRSATILEATSRAHASVEIAALRRRDALQLQASAILDDHWEPFLAFLREEGERYALAGFSYAAWFEMLGSLRDITRDELAAFLRDDPARNQDAVFEVARGLNRFVDLIASVIGEAYIETKQRGIAQAEARYRVMFEQSPQPMWMYEQDTLRFVAVNDAAVAHYGYTRDELLAMTIADIRPPEDVAALHKTVGEDIGRLANVQIWKHRKKDGSIILVEVRGNELRLNGRDVRVVQITDVTERVQAQEALRKTEDQLRQAQKMDAIGRLAGGVAHDFNNVLTVVQSYAAMLEDALDSTDARHADATEIRRAAERGAGITRQLLTLSRHSIVEPCAVNADELISGFLPMLRRFVGETIALDVHAGGVPTIVIDRGQLEQVLMNLAINARDAMPNGGRLTIETRTVEIDDEAAALQQRTGGAFVEISVTDTGCGIDADTRRRIFEPFFTTKEAGRGTGLGLSIVHGIVTQGGGHIAVYSEPGRGTTFRIQLPVNDGVAKPDTRPPIVAPTELPPLRILVVDDQPSVRAVALRVLKDAGCNVLEASSAEEARRLCVHDEEPIDIAVLDIVLPDGGGSDLIRQLSDLRPAMKFVQMSGYPAGALSATGAAPKDLLAKPFTPTELRAAIARVAADNTTTSTARTETTEVADPNKRRALVVDDDDSFRRSVARLLRRSQFDVVDVDSGYKAIATLEQQPFDVVVSDVQMPDGGGLDLLRAIRRIDLDVPVVLMTGEPSLEAAAQAVEYGAFRYLTKPLDTLAFTKTIQHAVRVHALARLRREAFTMTGSHAGVADRAGLEVRFEQAMAGMWMAFQPIVHTNGALFGVEALVRTTEPSIPHPGALLDAATQLGRLSLVGRRVRSLAATAMRSQPDSLALFVNLHPDDLHDADLVDSASLLATIAPRVILEITERASLETSPALSERIARLRALGFRLAVDDIGAGYSGLTSFTELMPEIVKLDMALVRDVHQSALKQRTIAALCKLCHEVDAMVVGEGVETVDERDCLISLGCDLLQGYLIGRPNRDIPR
jgi:PAS domain S-box-containing protein